MAGRGRVKIRDTDRGFQKFLKAMQTLSSQPPAVKVGVLGNTALAAKKTRGKGKSKFRVVDVATVHEFGGSRVPQRSFLRSTFDREYSTWRRWLAAQWPAVAKLHVEPEKVMRLLGEKMTAEVRLTFTTKNNWEPLSDATVNRRIARNPSIASAANDKFSGQKPLLDTGQLYRSIQYQVVKGLKKGQRGVR